jgi:hypothetical protein
MMNAIRNDNFREVEWTDAFIARNIVGWGTVS